MRVALIAALLLCSPGAAVAEKFLLPGPEGDMIGEMRSATVAEGQTLLDIARDNDLGYQEIVRANPDLDPWLPPVGAKVVLPTRYILPSATRTGIVVNLAEMRLYYFLPDKKSAGIRVFTYPLGIGQEGWSTPTGPSSITEKIKDPAWTVPESIRAAHSAEGRGDLPTVVPPGPDNPLGQYALRLENSRYLIHGTNKPYGVGRRISHGCIRMYPEDIEELFPLVPVGTRVMIIDQPYKVGRDSDALYIEAHVPIVENQQVQHDNLPQALAAVAAVTGAEKRQELRDRAAVIAEQHAGVPTYLAKIPHVVDEDLQGWVLQLGAFARVENATLLAERVKSHSLPVTVVARVSDGYCHVLVGPYADQGMAQNMRGKVADLVGYEPSLLRASLNGVLSNCIP